MICEMMTMIWEGTKKNLETIYNPCGTVKCYHFVLSIVDTRYNSLERLQSKKEIVSCLSTMYSDSVKNQVSRSVRASKTE